MPTKLKHQKNKFLLIKINKPIPEIVDDYCVASGFSNQDIGFNIGFIAGSGESLMPALVSLNQIFFFAGMYYAWSNQGNFDIRWVKDKPQTQVEKLKETLKRAQKDQEPSYVG